jgi:hypothetical protein
MCVVSAVIDQGSQIWPNPVPSWPGPSPLPTVTPCIGPSVLPQLEPLKDWTEMLRLAKKIDAATEQPDCEDPKKVEWAKSLCDRLTQIGKELIQLGLDTENPGVELIEIAKDIREILDI